MNVVGHHAVAENSPAFTVNATQAFDDDLGRIRIPKHLSSIAGTESEMTYRSRPFVNLSGQTRMTTCWKIRHPMRRILRMVNGGNQCKG